MTASALQPRPTVSKDFHSLRRLLSISAAGTLLTCSSDPMRCTVLSSILPFSVTANRSNARITNDTSGPYSHPDEPGVQCSVPGGPSLGLMLIMLGISHVICDSATSLQLHLWYRQGKAGWLARLLPSLYFVLVLALEACMSDNSVRTGPHKLSLITRSSLTPRLPL